MHITLNKRPVEVPDGATLEGLLLQEKLPVSGLALAVNRKVIPRNQIAQYTLQEGDHVMAIGAVKGG